MAAPWNIRGSASQLLYQHKQSSEYNALLAIPGLPPPGPIYIGLLRERFDAANPRESASFFLRVTSPQDHLRG